MHKVQLVAMLVYAKTTMVHSPQFSYKTTTSISSSSSSNGTFLLAQQGASLPMQMVDHTYTLCRWRWLAISCSSTLPAIWLVSKLLCAVHTAICCMLRVALCACVMCHGAPFRPTGLHSADRAY